MTNSSIFHVWAVVLLSTNMQNFIVSRFRRRSDAEEFLRLLRQTKPDKNYTIMYIPLEKIMRSIPAEWEMFSPEGNLEVTRMMNEVNASLSECPLPRVRSILQAKVKSVAERHPEIYDTEVRSAIVCRLTKWACEVHDLSAFALSAEYWDL